MVPRWQVNHLWFSLFKMHNSKQIPRGMGEVVFAVLAVQVTVDVGERAINQCRGWLAEFPIPIAIQLGSFAVGFSQPSQSNRANQIKTSLVVSVATGNLGATD
jgi:hypothetical protein